MRYIRMEQQFDKETMRMIQVLLSLQRALIGAVTPHLRAVNVSWDMHHIDIYFFYDGEISEDDQEESECAVTEVLANFPDDSMEAHHIRCDFPNKIPDLGERVVFQRREVIP